MRTPPRKATWSAAAVAVLAACLPGTAAGEPEPPRTFGPLAYQTDTGKVKCPPKLYCFFASPDFNEDAPSTSQDKHQAWAYHKQWEFFPREPGTSRPYVPDPTNKVKSVINRTNRDIFFMEWNYGTADGGTKKCLKVPAGRKVRDVSAVTGGDGGYGSVSFYHRSSCPVASPKRPD